MIESNLSFDNVIDPIKTEWTIHQQLKNVELPIPYVAIPLAYTINTKGLSETQRILNEIETQYPYKKFFVCQHIQVKNLNFFENLVFTPHTELSDNYFFVPHYNPLFDSKIDVKKIENRKLNMSFVGDFRSHQSRPFLSRLKGDGILVEDTGNWFFYKNEKEQEILKRKYIEILLESKLSLCPRGTGPSTLRLFESMSVGAVPIIFNDLKIPKEVNNLIYKIDLSNFQLNFNIEDIADKSKKLLDYYWSNLSNNNLSKSIIQTLKNI